MPFKINDRISASNYHVTDEGFLVFPEARIARTGIQEYLAYELGLEDRDPLDVIRVYRPEKEVFSDESKNSFANKVVTNNHPPEMINKENVKKFQVGYSGDSINVKGIFLTAKLVITDAKTIQDIKDGKVEISNGYVSDMEFIYGLTPSGEQYDAVQSGIKGNHIAIVDKARCGPSCRVADSKQPRKKPMKKITIDSVDYEASEQLVQAVNKMQQNHDAAVEAKQEEVDEAEAKAKEAEAKADEAEAKLDSVKLDHQKELDKMQAKLDDAEKNKITPEKLDAMIDSRLAIINVATKVIEKFDATGKDCEQIRKEVVAHVVGDSIDLDKKSSEYISARFDAISDTVKDNKSSKMADAFRKHAQNNDGDSSASTGRDKFVAKTRDDWKFGSQA